MRTNRKSTAALCAVVFLAWSGAIASAARIQITPEKRSFALGETVRYTIQKSGSEQIPLREAERRIVQRVASTDNVIRDFPRRDNWSTYAQYINQGKVVTFEWDQKDNRGNQVAPGPYRIYFKTPEFHTSVEITIESTSQVDVSLAPTKETYNKGETVELQLANRGAAAINLDGSRGIIYKVHPLSLGRRPDEFYTRPSADFLRGPLESRHALSWKWDQWDNEHQNRATAGRYLAKIWLPGVRKDPYEAEFRVK